MERRTRIAHMILLLAALWGVNFAISKSAGLPTGDKALWFHGGLLMLIVGLYWVEPFFTKPADVVINGLVVYISASTLTDPPLPEWWNALRILSLVLLGVSLAIIWFGGPVRAESELPGWKRVAYHLVTRLGSSRALFSGVFALSLVSYFDLQAPETRVLVAFWAIVLMLDALDLDVLFAQAWGRATRGKMRVVGTLSRFFEPGVARFSLTRGAVCPHGTLVGFTRGGRPTDRDPIALAVAQRTTAEGVEIEAVVLDSEFPAGAEAGHRVVVAGIDGIAAYQGRIMGRDRLQRAQEVIGLSRRDSTIARLSFEVFGTPEIEEGRLVSVDQRRGGPVLYQVVNGCLHEEVTLEHGERTFTVGEAEQLGNWSKERQGFESFGWVAPENGAVVLHRADANFDSVVVPKLVEVGHVPASPYPTNIKLEDLVLFHSAILGVTGSGKSFLAYYLIERCAEAGIKVICLDITGDYKRFLHQASLISNSAHIGQFLDSTQSIGIIEFPDQSHSPIAATQVIARKVLEWCRRQRTDTEIGEPKPRVLLVMEEAHALIPEWNSNPSPGLRDTVNATAQVFLQARKYGLGVMVVTQRTANVVKSVLNQCNTIFAFQAYDETGFEFMRNYMGDHFVRALPTLKKRHGVIVGKASASDKPVITRFLNQERAPRSGEATMFAPPAPPATPTSGS